MTFRYTDPDGHHIETTPDTNLDGQPVVTIRSRGEFATVPIDIPLDRIEDLIAGIRDTARQATQEPAHDGGPTVAEAAADDRAWPLQREGE